ncbi:SPOR domain-containing protein [Legionella sp. D16C41]|uniref:SPOR domain-containing protein n=1 Tax=Legionella sp. D16C41 TaxID=3402688 RepID=UPI003AF856F4
MKLIIDERLKHRLIGIAVIISIGTIFAPALIKTSSHRFDETISIQLPPKPLAPKLSMPEKQQTFQSIEVAHVEIPDIPTETKSLANKTQLKAEPISTLNDLKSTIVTATKETLKPNAQIASNSKPKVIDYKAKPKIMSVATASAKQVANSYIAPAKISATRALNAKKTYSTTKPKVVNGAKLYTVQLGMFSQQKNAIALVQKLKSKGYAASYNKVMSKKGVAYRVIVGQLSQKQQAILLQQQLASAMQLKGFIVNTRIS